MRAMRAPCEGDASTHVTNDIATERRMGTTDGGRLGVDDEEMWW